MILRCVDKRKLGPFEYGKEYDVAEILEFPEHAMVREKGSKTWPKPGHNFFAWHPEDFFECPKEGLEILSCGYRHIEKEFFGVLLDEDKCSKSLVQKAKKTDCFIERYKLIGPPKYEKVAIGISFCNLARADVSAAEKSLKMKFGYQRVDGWRKSYRGVGRLRW